MLLTDSTTIISRDNIQLIHIDNCFATAEISLFGGHIVSFTPKRDGRERLWVSEKSYFDGKKAIRGGIPICWPWFGAHDSKTHLTAHGYVRTQTWEIIKAEETTTDTVITLKPKTSVGYGFDGEAQLSLVVHVGAQLTVQLLTQNVGVTPFTYNCALHSYFAVTDVHRCELIGLTGQYSDKTRDYQIYETPQPYHFSEETDRVHLQKAQNLTIKDQQFETNIVSSGHDSIVVWNPWQDKSTSMQDMADDSYLTMLCVETAVTQGQTIKGGETHILEQTVL